MANMQRIGWVTVLALALAATSGCGFKLRGPIELPPPLEVTYIQGSPQNELVRELRRGLENVGARVTQERAEASAVLRLLKERFDRRVLSVGSTGKVTEYELTYQVRFDVLDAEGESLMEDQTLNLVRGYLNDESQVIGKADEEGLIREEMRRDAVRLMFYRMRAQLG